MESEQIVPNNGNTSSTEGVSPASVAPATVPPATVPPAVTQQPPVADVFATPGTMVMHPSPSFLESALKGFKRALPYAVGLGILTVIVYVSFSGGYRQLVGNIGDLSADTDGDGLINEEEFRYYTNPLLIDSDGDGVDDFTENKSGFNPLLWDTDADYVSDSLDSDPLVGSSDDNYYLDNDGDNLTDGFELVIGTYPSKPDSDENGISDGDEDADGDKVTNYEEFRLGSNPISADSDGDGLSDFEEATLPNVLAWDSDRDFVSDFVEVSSGISDFNVYDTDGDGLSDNQENANLDGVVDGTETDPGNPDTDGDGITDGEEVTRATDPLDPCSPIDVSNPDCVPPVDTDLDDDGVENDTDNCPEVSNAAQKDEDGDGVGDACDNCVADVNVEQVDTDADGEGDVCEDVVLPPEDTDYDGDGFEKDADNCPEVSNESQKDEDGDGVGDACDNCVADANEFQEDADADGIGNACEEIVAPVDTDADDDTIPDTSDNCPAIANTSQVDADADGAGDACDSTPTGTTTGGSTSGGSSSGGSSSGGSSSGGSSSGGSSSGGSSSGGSSSGGSSSGGRSSGGGSAYTTPLRVWHSPSTVTNTGLGSTTPTPTVPTATAPSVNLKSCFVARSGTFTDLTGHWSKTAVENAFKKSIVDGYVVDAKSVFAPDNYINRAEFTKIVLSSLCVKTPTVMSSLGFKDIQLNDWFTPYVVAAKQNGFISGYSDGTFRPGASLTRAEAIKILLVANGTQLGSSKTSAFTDVGNHWAVKYIETARKLGYVKGYADSTVRPDGFVTRAEAMVLVDRILLQTEVWKKYVQ